MRNINDEPANKIRQALQVLLINIDILTITHPVPARTLHVYREMRTAIDEITTETYRVEAAYNDLERLEALVDRDPFLVRIRRAAFDLATRVARLGGL